MSDIGVLAGLGNFIGDMQRWRTAVDEQLRHMRVHLECTSARTNVPFTPPPVTRASEEVRNRIRQYSFPIKQAELYDNELKILVDQAEEQRVMGPLIEFIKAFSISSSDWDTIQEDFEYNSAKAEKLGITKADFVYYRLDLIDNLVDKLSGKDLFEILGQETNKNLFKTLYTAVTDKRADLSRIRNIYSLSAMDFDKEAYFKILIGEKPGPKEHFEPSYALLMALTKDTSDQESFLSNCGLNSDLTVKKMVNNIRKFFSDSGDGNKASEVCNK